MLSQTATHTESSRPAISTYCVSPVSDLAKQNPLIEAMHMMGATMSFPSETEIFGEGEAADYAYQVVSGGVRTYKILSDGRRQIGGFYLPGDVFGLEFRDEHTFSAEAITDTRAVVVKRNMLMTLAGRDPGISRELLTLSGSELRHVQTRMLLLVNAEERVAGFHLEMAERASGGNCRASHDAPRYRRLSRSDLRNRLSDVEEPRKQGCHRDSDAAPDRPAQSLSAPAVERLSEGICALQAAGREYDHA